MIKHIIQPIAMSLSPRPPFDSIVSGHVISQLLIQHIKMYAIIAKVSIVCKYLSYYKSSHIVIISTRIDMM